MRVPRRTFGGGSRQAGATGDGAGDGRSAGWRRRSVLGLLGAAPLAAGAGAWGGTGALALADTDTDTATGAVGHRSVPRDLRPGGDYDRLVARLAAEGSFSGTVLLAHRGRTVLNPSHGMANRELSRPNGPETIFDLASVGKWFTAVAIVQLVRRGQVGLGETVGAYLDGFPAEVADTVTVHHLLTHRSGLGDYQESPAYREQSGTWASEAETMEGLLAIIRQEGLQFTPGTSSDYSNSGYEVLGGIVAAASGQPYHDYVREHVFAAADMTATGFYTRPERLDDRRIARRYATQPSGERVDLSDQDPFVGTPAGHAFAPAPDMLRFALALQDGTLLPPAYADLALNGKEPSAPGDAPAAEGTVRTTCAGYGSNATILDDQRIAGMGGGAPGVSAHLGIYPDLDWVAVTLCNYGSEAVRTLLPREQQLITAQGS